MTRAIELNTMDNPRRAFSDETTRQRCPKCGNTFRLGYGMDVDREVAAVTEKHMELCEGDAAITLFMVDAAFKAGWRP